jgi:hypothetical protein
VLFGLGVVEVGIAESPAPPLFRDPL